jgi:hypothetical protein
MNAQSKQGWSALKTAKSGFLNWAASNDIAVHCVEYVAGFEDWHKRAEIYVFFPTDTDLEQHRKTGRLQVIEAHYRQLLAEAQYPQERCPAHFYFDSHENVVKNYEGNYFYRLR